MSETKPEVSESKEDDEYACVARGRLNLKSESSRGKKRKRRAEAEAAEPDQGDSRSKPTELKRTPAEKAFQKMQEKMQKERIAQKASMTHKQRVEKFNQHLDSLTEHFDIPKVSWTK